MRSALERAARALCALDGHPENAKMDGKPLWQNYLPEAQAVLQAIRDPSEAMIELFEGPAGDAGWGMDKRKADLLTRTWNGLVDAALKEWEGET